MTKQRCICPTCGAGYVPVYLGRPVDRQPAERAERRVCWGCYNGWRKNLWLSGPIALGAELGLQVLPLRR